MNRYHIPTAPWGLVLLLVMSPLLLGVRPWMRLEPGLLWPTVGALLLAYLGLLAFSLVVLVVDIRAEGIVLYRINRLQWTEVVSARKCRVLGLPYLIVWRRRGGPRWLPLYFTGKGDLRSVLQRNAPAEHPISLALT